MTHLCNYCVKEKPCRKIVIYLDECGYPYLYFRPIILVCKECNDYFKEIRRVENIESQKKIQREREEFIQRRDKLLKEIKK